MKFRMYDIDNETMEYADFSNLEETIEILDSYMNYYGKGYFNDEKYLMKYTGLNDKNDKEIYGGDIIEYQGYPENPTYRERRLVKEVKGGFVLEHLWTNDNMPHESEYMMQLWFATIPERYVVIGNIYKNKELLKKGDKL